MTCAICLSSNIASHGVMAPMKVCPFTVIGPAAPFRTIMEMRSVPFNTHSEPASGGNTAGNHCPDAW